MDRKGFTLIEISVSVALLSVVLLFVINMLTIIRNDEDNIAVDTKLELNKAIISKTINDDILNNDGIKNVTCENELSCSLTLNKDDALRKIYITKGTDNKENALVSVLNYEEIKEGNTNILFTRKTLINILTINVEEHPEYNIEIVSKNN